MKGELGSGSPVPAAQIEAHSDTPAEDGQQQAPPAAAQPAEGEQA